MKETKLIIVTGMSGVGKSSTSQNIARLYKRNCIEYYRYHEEMKDHPIRWANGGEFKIGSLYTEEGMQKNIEDIYERWEKFIDYILSAGGVHVMEGCLFQNIIRYFFTGNYPKEKIIAYYDELMKVLEKANPHIIFLHHPDVKANLERAFKVRGEKWKKLILDPERVAYFETHKYSGDESIFLMWEDYQNLSYEIFERFPVKKLKIDTSGEEWESYLKEIAIFLNLKYCKKEIPQIGTLDKYCGTFTDGFYEVKVILEDNILYYSPSWFNHIKMIPLGYDVFELLGFPIIFTYSFSQGKKSITVSGNYDWELTGKTLMVVNST